MILYHGSNTGIEAIDLGRCSRYKDFGRAFYLSADMQQAKEMGEFRVRISREGETTVTSYEFNEQLLSEESTLKVKIFPHYCLEWAEFVWNNRDENQDFHHPYDIVYGPIANDNVGFQMRRFRVNGGDLHEFLKGLKYSKGETFQYAFCTPEAIKMLKKL
ncbi:MAG: DUF3990 domain-containing protein [Bacteroidales bacterium]|nr:DUF3990 domain-containing protein [Bacteroidales bacterium]